MSPLVLLVNGIFLLIAFITAIALLYAGSRYSFYYGLAAIQEKYKWRVLQCLITFVVLSFVAAIFNLASAFLGI